MCQVVSGFLPSWGGDWVKLTFVDWIKAPVMLMSSHVGRNGTVCKGMFHVSWQIWEYYGDATCSPRLVETVGFLVLWYFTATGSQTSWTSVSLSLTLIKWCRTSMSLISLSLFLPAGFYPLSVGQCPVATVSTGLLPVRTVLFWRSR